MLFLEERGGGKEVFYGVRPRDKHRFYSPKKIFVFSAFTEITSRKGLLTPKRTFELTQE